MDLGLDGSIALVVGGSGLIGSAVARSLRAEGATVVIAGRSADKLQEAASAIGEGVDTVVLDSGDDTSVSDAVASVLQRHRRIDVLVATAAPSAQTLDPKRNNEPGQVTEAFVAKTMGSLRVANAVLPHMRDAGYGRVVTVSGQNAYLTGNITGAVRNGALIIAMKSLADDLAGTGVTVNVVNPGIVKDDYDREVGPGQAGQSSPEQVAAVVTFLASRTAVLSGESVAVGHRVRGVSAF